MVALSLVICTKRAKIIFARQFVEMTRIQLEEYIVQFSRNIDSFKEITQFESESVRYIFIPIEEFFLILITSNNSNVIGIYCSRCGKWFKWADKDEKNLMRLAESENKKI